MIYSKHRFTLDMQVEHSQISIPVTVGDTGKVFLINLSDGGVPYKIPDGSLAMLTIHRPTGTHLQAFCPIKSNSTIEYDFMQNENTAAVEGVHDCELTLYGNVSGSVVSTAWFTMIVSARVVDSDDLNITDEDRSAIDAMIDAEATRQSAELARINAESGRVDAENSRIAAEEERQAYYEDFMSRVDSGEFGCDTSELEQTVDRHTVQIERIDQRVGALEGGGGDTTELKQRIANAEADIEALDQRVEVNEESIRDLYGKLPSGGEIDPALQQTVEKHTADIAKNAGAIEALDQRVEENEESIRDLYDKVQNGGSGGELPEITGEGDVLATHDGKAEWLGLFNFENVNKTLVLTLGETVPGFTSAFDPIGLVEGKTYYVATDSGTFTAVAKVQGDVKYLGNAFEWGGMGYENTGESFYYAEEHTPWGDTQSAKDLNLGKAMAIAYESVERKIDPSLLPDDIGGLPELTPEDKDKVLTANADGTAAWKDPKGGLSVTEITSPEEITADSPDGLYIQEGGSGGNSGGTTIHYYDSLDAVPADLPEKSFLAVPAEESAGGGGLPVVELTTHVEDMAVFTTEENILLNAAWESGMPVLIKCSIKVSSNLLQNFVGLAMRGALGGAIQTFGITFGSSLIAITCTGSDGSGIPGWAASEMPM